jgi:hypothetical protein
MHRTILAAIALVTLSVAFIPPAFAMKGIDATRSCNAQPARCHAHIDPSGSVVISVDGYIIICPAPDQECQVDVRPTRTIPGSKGGVTGPKDLPIGR